MAHSAVADTRGGGGERAIVPSLGGSRNVNVMVRKNEKNEKGPF